MSWSYSGRERKEVKEEEHGQNQVFRHKELPICTIFSFFFSMFKIFLQRPENVKSEIPVQAFHNRRWGFEEDVKYYRIYSRTTLIARRRTE